MGSSRLGVGASPFIARGTATPALYLALAGSGLASKVMRGENGGATLAHDLEL